MNEMSDFELIIEILSNASPMTTKDIVKKARINKHLLTKSEVNSTLYRMLKRDLVTRIENEGELAPLWSLPNLGTSNVEKMLARNVKKKPKRMNLDPGPLPLESNPGLSLKIQGVEIQFAIDDAMSIHDPYMHGDWLDNKVFVTLNPNHPFWTTFVSNEDRLAFYTALIAQEVYVQWQVARRESNITPSILHALRDKTMRDLAIHSNASRNAKVD